MTQCWLFSSHVWVKYGPVQPLSLNELMLVLSTHDLVKYGHFLGWFKPRLVSECIVCVCMFCSDSSFQNLRFMCSDCRLNCVFDESFIMCKQESRVWLWSITCDHFISNWSAYGTSASAKKTLVIKLSQKTQCRRDQWSNCVKALGGPLTSPTKNVCFQFT